MTQPIFILLPVHNRREITRGFVECLRAQTYDDYHLILIDDGSTDGTAEAVRDDIPGVTVLSGSGSWWWAGSLQQALDWLASAGVDDEALILMINDDVRFASDYLARAVRVMAENRDTLVLSQFQDPSTGSIMETGVHADFRRMRFTIAERPEDINCLSTRGLFLRWGDIRRIGGFHPVLLPHYASDYEYTIRAYRMGLACRTSRQLLIQPDLCTTGFHVIGGGGLPETVARLFSKKAPANPVYWSSFLLLACEPLWILPNLARTWYSAARVILRAMVGR